MRFKGSGMNKGFKYPLLVLFLLFMSAGQSLSQSDLSWPPEGYPLHPGNVTQSEVFIVNHPTDPDVLFASCNTLSFIPFFVSEGIYVSTNSGQSWLGTDTCSGNPILFHGGDPGISINLNGRFILTRLGQAPFTGLYSHYSDDLGQTWSDQVVLSTDDLERAALTTDVNPSSAFANRTYAVWIKFAQPFPLMMSRSDDGGQSWTSPAAVNNPPVRSAGGDVAIGPNGEVYACWAGVSESSPFKEIQIGFARSDNGGMEWTVTENTFPVNGITGILPEKGNIRVNGLPRIAVDTTSGPRKGWIYIVTGQKELAPAGNDPDIILYRSPDQGISWSPGIRVNQDALNNGKIQYFPAIHVDQYGAVNVLFYDDRNTSSDSTGVTLARSRDGGASWNEYPVSDHHFKPEPIGGLGQGYQGDNIDLTSNDSTLWPVWMDNVSGIYQIWTAPIDFTALLGMENRRVSGSQEDGLFIRPNPFMGSTNVRFNVKDKEQVFLYVYSPTGHLQKALNLGIRNKGAHEVPLSLPGQKGIYFVQLKIGGKMYSEKLIHLGE
jgi:hypothetical protein